MEIKNTIIFLDLMTLILSILWVFFSISKGIDWFELIFVYFYYTLILVTLILNLVVLNKKTEER